jgi:predicted ABC-type exoprotein transport system permease subunit
MGAFSVFHWLIVLVLVVVIAWPITKILGRLGISRWWAILAFLPLINLVGLWILSVVRWPKIDGAGR